jgi:hypothetical protein
MAAWRIEGQYMETCNCNYLCPCAPSNLTAQPTEGDCKAAIAMRIDKGEKDGVKLDGLSFIVVMHSPKAGDLIDQACEGVAGAARPNEPLHLDNTAHPVNARLALAKATRSIFNAFGVQWKDTSGTRNGHFAPFAWTG